MKSFDISDVRGGGHSDKLSKEEQKRMQKAKKAFDMFPPAATLPNGRTSTDFKWEYYD